MRRLALRTGAPMAAVDVHAAGAVVLRWTNPAMADLLGLSSDGSTRTLVADALSEDSGARLAGAARDLVALTAQTTSVQVRIDGAGRGELGWFHLVVDTAGGAAPGQVAVPAVLHAGSPPLTSPVSTDDGPGGRALLVERLSAALLRLHRRPSRVALVMARVRHPHETGSGGVDDLETAELAGRVRAAARDTDTVVALGTGHLAVLAEDPADDGGIAMARRVRGVLRQPVVPDVRPSVTVAALEVADATADPEAVLLHLEEATGPGAGEGLTVLAAWGKGRSAPRPAAGPDAGSHQRIMGALESGRFVLGLRPASPASGVRGQVRDPLPLAEVHTVDDSTLTPVRVDAAGLASAVDHWALQQVGELDWGPRPQLALRLQPGGSLSRLRPHVQELLDRRPGLRLHLQVPEPRLAEAVSAQRAVLGQLVALGVGLGVSDWTGLLDVRTLVRWQVGLVGLSARWAQDVRHPDGAAAVAGLVAGLRAGLGPTALVVAEEPADAASRAALAACGVHWTAPGEAELHPAA